jgi:glucose-6-phosphate isomerase/transaldolase/glucose-6-phosphate isomerase
MQDLYDLGAQFFLWEMATAIAGQRLGIQPFDQPDVEAAKSAARSLVSEYQQSGRLPEPARTITEDRISVYADFPAQSLNKAWQTFLGKAPPGAYIAIQSYIPPSPETDASLLELRTRLRDLTGLAVTTGYGPRFLHSTGQIHKGGQAGGLFVQITALPPLDAPIPDEAGQAASAITFGMLEASQAIGDRQALLDAGRQVLRFHIEGDVLVELSRLTQTAGPV